MNVIAAVLAAWMLCAGEPSGVFQHKAHAPLKLKCASCHTTVEKEDAASFPGVAVCRGCHTAIGERTIPSKRLVSIPNFVIFGHSAHVAGKVECALCHGDVWSGTGPREAKPVKMAECVDCHKERKATMVCNSCHELGQ
jgi:hypothetical protein